MSTFRADIWLALRTLRRRPGLTIVAVIALALGIGLTTTMFSIVYGVVLRGLPFEESESIVSVTRSNPRDGNSRLRFSPRDFWDFIDRQSSLEDLAGYRPINITLSVGSEGAERHPASYVTINGFAVLRVTPVLGRDFIEDDGAPDAPKVSIIGYRVWQDRFAGDPAVLGRSIRIDGEATTIVGVMPERFAFPGFQQIWLPYTVDPLLLARGEGPGISAFGRLLPGVAIEQARTDFSTIAQQLATDFPRTNSEMGVFLGSYVDEVLGSQTRAFMFTMLGAVTLVLVVACANVANLLLARAVSREREIGIRSALGARRLHILSLLSAEPGILALAGGLLGIALAKLGVRAFTNAWQAIPTPLPFFVDIKIDRAALWFVLAATIVSSVLAGVLPAIKASRGDLASVLGDGSRTSAAWRMGKLSQLLVIGEIALSCVVLAGAGLLTRSVINLASLDMSITLDSVFVAGITLTPTSHPTHESQLRFFDELRQRVSRLPGVDEVALTSSLPVVGGGNVTLAVEGIAYENDASLPRTRFGSYTPGFLGTIGSAVLRGRDFTDRDRMTAPRVAVVNEAFVAAFFPTEDPIGRRVRLERSDEGSWVTIVGVVPTMYVDFEAAPLPPHSLYVPVAQRAGTFANIVARTTGDPRALTPAVRKELASLDPDVPLIQPSTLRDRITSTFLPVRIMSTTFALFGVAGLSLAAVGLYGVMAFAVRRRTREVGVRIALGAQRSAVVGLIVRQGLIQLGIGLAVGLALATLFGRLLSVALVDVSAGDPVVLGLVALALIVSGGLASFVPALRAARIDPVAAIRRE